MRHSERVYGCLAHLSIWRHFIPSDDRHVFERGAYFSAEVIPDRLAVISLNTMFWFDSNTRALLSLSSSPGSDSSRRRLPTQVT